MQNPFRYFDKNFDENNTEFYYKRLIEKKYFNDKKKFDHTQCYISRSMIYEDNFDSELDNVYEIYDNYNKNVLIFLNCKKIYKKCAKQLFELKIKVNNDFTKLNEDEIFEIINLKECKKNNKNKIDDALQNIISCADKMNNYNFKTYENPIYTPKYDIIKHEWKI